MNRHACLFVALTACTLTACRQDMHDSAYKEPFEESSFFADGRSSRPQVAGTVARGHLFDDEHLHDGRVGGEYATEFPMPVTQKLVERGRGRFNVNCSPCHDAAGTGQGMVVKRGFTAPPSLHIERLREAPHGYFFDVITNGFGAMYDQADRITHEDRWAIIAYLRALQLSQNATVDDIPGAARAELEGEGR